MTNPIRCLQIQPANQIRFLNSLFKELILKTGKSFDTKLNQ
jgi:hypothetical protein